jgi:hypothetical protein
MVNCLMAYKIVCADNPDLAFCREGTEKRGCPGCCVDCDNKCNEEEEPNTCKIPVASAD